MTSLLQQNTALRASHASMDAYASRCASRLAALVSQAKTDEAVHVHCYVRFLEESAHPNPNPNRNPQPNPNPHPNPYPYPYPYPNLNPYPNPNPNPF